MKLQMLKEIKIRDFGSYVETIININEEQQYRMWYRGQSDYSWELVPSVQRVKNMGKHYEQYITTNFMIQAMRLKPQMPQQYDRSSWLTLMQQNKDAAVWVLNPMKLNEKAEYGTYVPPINYKSLEGDLEGAFSDKDNESIKLQKRIVACHGVGNDLRMYVQQSDFTIHSSAEKLNRILAMDDACDYFYKIRIPKDSCKSLLNQLDALGFHESTIYPDMEHIAQEQKGTHFDF